MKCWIERPIGYHEPTISLFLSKLFEPSLLLQVKSSPISISFWANKALIVKRWVKQELMNSSVWTFCLKLRVKNHFTNSVNSKNYLIFQIHFWKKHRKKGALISSRDTKVYVSGSYLVQTLKIFDGENMDSLSKKSLNQYIGVSPTSAIWMIIHPNFWDEWKKTKYRESIENSQC